MKEAAQEPHMSYERPQNIPGTLQILRKVAGLSVLPKTRALNYCSEAD